MFEDYKKSFEAESASDMKSMLEMVEKSTGGSKKVKEESIGRALADFGFKWAAAAAKPGAKFFGSAAEASPTLTASLAESAKLAREMDENDLKLRMNLKQFQIAQRAGNRKEALAAAAQERMLMQNQAQLELKARELALEGAYKRGVLGMQEKDLARKEAADKARGLSAAAAGLRAQASVMEVGRKAGLDFDNSRSARDLMKQLTEQHGPEKAKYLYNQQRRAYINEATQGAREQSEGNLQARSVYDLLSAE